MNAEQPFNALREKYIRLKGKEAYSKLEQKILHSKAFNELLGMSVRRGGMPPAVGDFNYLSNVMPGMRLCFDTAKTTMAAILMLHIWDEQINQMYGLCPPQIVASMMRQIAARCIYLHGC